MILLVEDDVDVSEMLEFAFRSKGFAVEVATNGTAALNAIERHRPCLVILDLIMPRMTGWQFMAQLKERKLADLPICLISAVGTSLPTDAVASFQKPFDVKELVAFAARYCSHAHAT